MRPSLTLLVLLIATHVAFCADKSQEWKAGVARTEITPRTFMWMAGYASRTKPAEGKAQELHAKALALEDGEGKRIVIVTLDLISVPRSLRDKLEVAVQRAHGLPREGLLLNCSHTHCGPELRTSPVPRPGETPERAQLAQQYSEELGKKLIGLIDSALKDLSPAKLSFLHARCGFAMNRRLPVADGWANSPNPDGPVDHDVPVLRVDSPAGKLRAVLFGYACHNTTLSFYQWCGDYAGFAQEWIERTNPGATALFLNGCGGDQNPYPRGTLELAQQHGAALANAVAAAIQTRPRAISGPLQAALEDVAIPYAPPIPTREDLLKRQKSTSDRYERNHAERLLHRLESQGRLPESYSAPVHVVRFGEDLVLVAFPGETVVDYSLRVKKELGGKGHDVWVAGYSNDVFAYLPSQRVLREGGYEGGGAMKFMNYPHPGPFADTVEERVIGKAHELYKRLNQAPTAK